METKTMESLVTPVDQNRTTKSLLGNNAPAKGSNTGSCGTAAGPGATTLSVVASQSNSNVVSIAA